MKKTEAIQKINSLEDEDIIMAVWQFSNFAPWDNIDLYYKCREEIMPILDDLYHVSKEDIQDAIIDFIYDKVEGDN
jgi:hypothetical protein